MDATALRSKARCARHDLCDLCQYFRSWLRLLLALILRLLSLLLRSHLTRSRMRTLRTKTDSRLRLKSFKKPIEKRRRWRSSMRQKLKKRRPRKNKKTGAKRQRTEGPEKEDDAAQISEYEKNRNATKQANGAYLEFIDKVSEKECKILDKGGDTISNMNLGGFTPDM